MQPAQVSFAETSSPATSMYRASSSATVTPESGCCPAVACSNRRLRAAHPNAIMIHTPGHASWLNQVEIFFSIIQKKVVSPNDLARLDQLSGILLAFADRYNQTARPFNWKYTAADLARLLDQITAHENPASLPQAA